MKAGKGILFFIPKTIKGQMIIMISVLVFLQIGVTAVLFNGIVGNFLEESHKKRTLDFAKTVARMPMVISALRSGETNEQLQNILLDMQKEIGAQFIVVARRDGIRLAHPVKERIGQKFVGGDFSAAVQNGESYTSRAVGTLGLSLRGFSPVKDIDGSILGFASVGYLETSVMKVIHNAQKEPATYLFIMLFVGLITASMIAGYVKKLTLGLEPYEIASLHREREVILNSVRAGIIAVNEEGLIRFTNNEAKRILGLADEMTGANIENFLPEVMLTQRMQNRDEVKDEELFINGHLTLFNIKTVIINDKVYGAVATFRRKGEMDYLNNELQQVRQCSELLRVQSHEYSNKLHAISGLLQLEEYDEAKSVILKESEGYHKLVEFTDTNVNCPMIAGIILGKYNRAGEIKCAFEVDFTGKWVTSPTKPEQVVTVLGNLLDNAIDAAKSNTLVAPKVSMRLFEEEDHLFMQVEDTGKGLPTDIDIFQKGVSTKSDSRGIGLYNLSMALKALDGHIEAGVSDRLGGACFIVKLPITRQI
ncbi:MAG: sensor histidine kinase [Denitrovibrio sp.]|nr:MAG: sensor histidine kinase [Denitrovibrio sp.]